MAHMLWPMSLADPSPLRARAYGISLDGEPGPLNAITDIPGVEVGFETIIEGEGPSVRGVGSARSGVTAILPLGRERVGLSCPAGWYSLNGNGEMTGTAWLDEVGALSLPIGITNTHAIGRLTQIQVCPSVGSCRSWPKRGMAISTILTAHTSNLPLQSER
jgi:D-aminopeptidase